MLHVPLGFLDPENDGWHVTPPLLGVTNPAAHITVTDDMAVFTDDPRVLDSLAKRVLNSARALRISLGFKECDHCGDLVPRVFSTPVEVGRPSDHAGSGEIEVFALCQVCAGISDDDLAVDDDAELNLRGAA